MKYIPPTKEVEEKVILMFNEYRQKKITENELLTELNNMHDNKEINDYDREILGWVLVLGRELQ
jgi:hypothetical protein